MRISRWLSASGALLAAVLPAPARAAGKPEHVVLSYTAPAECPNEEAFFAAVDARRKATGGSQYAPQTGRTFDIALERASATRFRGTLRVTDGDDVRERVAEEPRCDSLVRVLAVFTALAIDVDAPAAPPPPPSPSRPSLPADTSPPTPPGTEPLPSSPLEIQRVPSRVRVGVSLAGRFDLSSGGAGLTAAIDLSRERPNGWSPAIRIGGVTESSGWNFGKGSDGLPVATGSTELRAGFLDLCPLRYDLVDLYVQTCARGELGTFDLSVLGPSYGPSPARESQWASVGATAGLRANVWRYFFIDVEAGLTAPLTNQRVDARDGQTEYSTSISTWLGLGFGGYLVAIKIPSDAH